jgi:hypothetical protein
MADSQEVSDAEARIRQWIAAAQDARDGKRAADGRSDSESLERAADLDLVYDAMEWVADMPAPVIRKPGPKGGRPKGRIDPKSREQYAKWVRQHFGWGSAARLSQLHTAHEFVVSRNTVTGNHPSGEGALRPLWHLRDEGYGDHIDRVWEDAVKLACGLPVTTTETRKAVNAFLEAHKPDIRNLASDDRTAAEIRAAKRKRLIAEFDAILADENATAKQALNEMIQHFNEHQQQLKAS